MQRNKLILRATLLLVSGLLFLLPARYAPAIVGTDLLNGNGNFENGFYQHSDNLMLPNNWLLGAKSGADYSIGASGDNGPSVTGQTSFDWTMPAGTTIFARYELGTLPVSGYSSIILSLDAKNPSASSPLSGVPAATGYPVYVQVAYLDGSGNGHWWECGWNNSGWNTYSADIMEGSDIAALKSVWIGAWGDSYSGRIDNVQLLGVAGPPSAVPEPATIALFGAGLIGLVGLRKRKS